MMEHAVSPDPLQADPAPPGAAEEPKQPKEGQQAQEQQQGQGQQEQQEPRKERINPGACWPFTRVLAALGFVFLIFPPGLALTCVLWIYSVILGLLKPLLRRCCAHTRIDADDLPAPSTFLPEALPRGAPAGAPGPGSQGAQDGAQAAQGSVLPEAPAPGTEAPGTEAVAAQGSTGTEGVAGIGSIGSIGSVEGEGGEEGPNTLDHVAEDSYLGGVPRRWVLAGVHFIGLSHTRLVSPLTVVNQRRLLDLVQRRPRGTPLITVSNHMSILDDPFIWGQTRLKAWDPDYCRWTLVARDVCFPNKPVGWLFRLARCIPLDRTGGINQKGMDEAVRRLRNGEWLHIFPEGGITQSRAAMRRLKFGLASLIHRCSLDQDPSAPQALPDAAAAGAGGGGGGAGGETAVAVAPPAPILLCIGHSGFEMMMPEPKVFGKRALMPLWGQRVTAVVGEPFRFDVPRLQEIARDAEAAARDSPDSPLAAFGLPAKDLPPTAEPAQLAIQAPAPVPETAGEAGAGMSLVPSGGAPVRGRGGVKDEVTRRLYQHMTDEVTRQLNAVVTRAHERQIAKGRGTH